MNDGIIVLIAIGALAILVFVAIRRGWVTGPRGHFTGMTVYHDWLNQDAQRGTEVIIQRNAGAKEADDRSGAPLDPASDDGVHGPEETNK